ncbi:MAG: MerR family transcriptional regulator [Pyrinomonadaceae bacterium]|nr:MerR family transcriptional regulator [Pyrinomonadaceae bacterium]
MRSSGEKLWQTNEFAKQAGVTARTLHHYDRIGLLKPNRRTAKGFRVYGEAEFARLQQISTLKFIGFSLIQIKEILGNQSFDLAQTLKMQRTLLEAQRFRLTQIIEAIAKAQETFDQSKIADLESFQKIIEVMNMEQNFDWTKKYYSAEGQKAVEERKNLWSPELQERVTRDWSDLVADIETAIKEGISPNDEKAQALANRWQNLITEFTGGNPEIQKGLNKMYADEKNWQTEWKKPFSDEVQNFIAEAMKAKQ